MENKSYIRNDGPRKLPLKLLENMTDSFHEDQRLGSGAFGDVYKGVLGGEVIAVKLIRFMSGITDKQFKNEYEHLSKLKHQNIVQLVGFCDETKKVLVLHREQMVSAVEIHRALCLEFVPNGCLGKFLSDQCLVHDWHVRFKMIKGICEGLNYLHGFSVMHLDLKPSNILLDEEMVPKIADFGLSRLMGEENTIITMTSQGTLGYMPPEFIKNQIISKKYDIFSLGVIIKKILSGEMVYFRIAEMRNEECIEHVYSYWEKKLQETPRYASLEVECKQVRSCIEIAVACTELDRQKRPTIKEIIRKLNELEVKENDSRSQIEQDTMNIVENKSQSTSDGPKELSLKLLKEIKKSSRKLQLKLLEEITNNFGEEQRIGSGAFGAVYKGVLGGEVIAVKLLRFMSGITDKQFKNEYKHLSKLKHQNIVQLVGFCDETKKVLVREQMISAVEIHRALCLEFVPNGCLGKFLSDQCLVHDWHVRFKMIKGICEGLNYLHEFSVMHLDLKPGNILLDENMIPKIADFGLSRLIGEENTIITMSRLGTPGYMPPEFIKNQIISTKYDIFSLGVILKRIVSGEMDYFSFAEMGNQECIEHVHNYWEKKLQKTPRYPSLEVDCKQVRSCIEIAVDCTKRNRRKRPTIEDIVRKLDKLEVKEDDSRSQIEQTMMKQMTMPPNAGRGDKKGGANEIPVQIKGNGNNGSGKKNEGGGGGNCHGSRENRGGVGQPNNVKGGGGASVGGHHPDQGKNGGGAAGSAVGVGGLMGGGMPPQQPAMMRPNMMDDAGFPGMGQPQMGGHAVQGMAAGRMPAAGFYQAGGRMPPQQPAMMRPNMMDDAGFPGMGQPQMGGRAVQGMAAGRVPAAGFYQAGGSMPPQQPARMRPNMMDGAGFPGMGQPQMGGRAVQGMAAGRMPAAGFYQAGGSMPPQQPAMMRPNMMDGAGFPGMGQPQMGGRAVQGMAAGRMPAAGFYQAGGSEGVQQQQQQQQQQRMPDPMLYHQDPRSDPYHIFSDENPNSCSVM